MRGKRKNTPDQVDQLLAQHTQKKRARAAEDLVDHAIGEIDDALAQLSKTPVPADARQKLADALKQVKVARTTLGIYVERLPPKEPS